MKMLKKFCEVSSCNGIIDLYEARTKKYHLIFWALVMTCMIVGSAYFTFSTIRCYITSPIVTNVATVYEKSLDMPEVLICYKGGMNTSAMMAANFSRDSIRVLGSSLEFKPSEATNIELMNYTKTNNLSLRDVRQYFSYKCEEMVEMFRVPPKLNKLKNDSRCDLVVPLYTGNNACYLFKNNGQQSYPGDGGVEITLKGLPIVNENIFTRKEMLTNKMANVYTISMERTFGEQISQRSVTIPLNSMVTITLNTKRYVRLPTTNKCDSRPEIYTSNTCFQNCYLDQNVKDCNCQTIYFSNYKRYPHVDLCDPLTEWNCHLNITSMKQCEETCLAKCDEWIFEYTISMSTFYDADVNEDSTTHVSIQYDTMQYTKIEEVEAFTMDMAVSNVGGQSGLWLGASFVTIIQATYYLTLAVARKIGSRYNETIKITVSLLFLLPSCLNYLLIHLLQIQIGLWIDLTYANKYYKKEDVENFGAKYVKLTCKGLGECPCESLSETRLFNETCNSFWKDNPGSLIAAHCTHGFNRTGFLIVSFLVMEIDWSVDAALKAFEISRPTEIYKIDYLKELFKRLDNSYDDHGSSFGLLVKWYEACAGASSIRSSNFKKAAPLVFLVFLILNYLMTNRRHVLCKKYVKNTAIGKSTKSGFLFIFFTSDYCSCCKVVLI